MRASGQLEEAERWYEIALDWTPLMPYWGPALFRLCELHASRGMVDRARRECARFVNLWRDAEPEFQPYVEAALRTIERLGAG